MIDRHYRGFAKDVASGCPAHPSTERDTQKAVTYGLLARAMSMIALPSASEVLKDRKPGAVGSVTNMLSVDLKARFSELLQDNSDLQDETEDAINARLNQVYGYPVHRTVEQRMHEGVNTAIDIETTTLATIRMYNTQGQAISREGLSKSQRIPFAFAMQALSNLDPSCSALFTRTYIPDSKMRGVTNSETVFKPGTTALSASQGLRLSSNIPQRKSWSDFSHEATIGCPATLVTGFVRGVHEVAAEACVEAGIITPTDS